MEECFDCPARITSKELAPIHYVKMASSSMLRSTSRRMDADLVKKCSYLHCQVAEQPGKRSKNNGDKSAAAMLKSMSSIKEHGDLFWTLTHQIHDNGLRNSGC